METVQALEVYIGERGYVCIKQEDPLGETEDIVAMLPQQVPTIMRWLQECAAEIEARQRAEVPGPRLVVPPAIADSTRPAPTSSDAGGRR